MKPLSPEEVLEQRHEAFPDFVIEAVNTLLKRNYNGCDCVITLKEVEKEIKSRKPPELDWEQWWLDFESIYRKAGWSVVFDKPGYNESYPSTYSFTRKK